MTKNNCPTWANRLTVGIAIPHIDPEVVSELLPHKDSVVSVVWKRLSKAARMALFNWGKCL